MPAFEQASGPQHGGPSQGAQFPPVTREHILHCSYDRWHPKYRTCTIRSRIIPLPPEFIEYIREDGILLADEDENGEGEDDDWEPTNPGTHHPPLDGQESDSEDDGSPQPRTRIPPNHRFPALHQRIKDEISSLGGAVAPKLNWSSPKDAAWIRGNSVECRTPDDVYLLLKSSSFVSHDLWHAFDGCAPSSTPNPALPGLGFNPMLVLRQYFNPQTALEFRCFVKHRNLVAITPRDLKYYPFLEGLRPTIIARTTELFNSRLKFTFPDGCFAFDVYIPESFGDESSGLSRARLIDINPWAPRTDSLLFDWAELLCLHVPRPILGVVGDGDKTQDEDAADDDEGDDFEPELRLIDKDNVSAFNFNSSQYSAHKMPKEVVDATLSGEGGLRAFAEQWQQLVESRDR